MTCVMPKINRSNIESLNNFCKVLFGKLCTLRTPYTRFREHQSSYLFHKVILRKVDIKKAFVGGIKKAAVKDFLTTA